MLRELNIPSSFAICRNGGVSFFHEYVKDCAVASEYVCSACFTKHFANTHTVPHRSGFINKDSFIIAVDEKKRILAETDSKAYANLAPAPAPTQIQTTTLTQAPVATLDDLIEKQVKTVTMYSKNGVAKTITIGYNQKPNKSMLLPGYSWTL